MSIDEFGNELYELGYYTFVLKRTEVTTGDTYSIEVDDNCFSGDFLENLFEEVVREMETLSMRGIF